MSHTACDMLIRACLLLFLLAGCHASVDSQKSSNNYFAKALRYFEGWNDNTNQQTTQSSKKLLGGNFHWANCGSSGDLATIKSLNISPDPIHIPGNVTVSFSGSLSQQMAAPVQLSLEVKKKEFFWIPIPCVDGVGSCDYDDVCSIMASFKCPPPIVKYGLPCHCPIKSGDYKLPSSVVDVQSFGIPSWLEDGDFQVKATMKYKGRQVMCVQIDFTLG